MNCPFCDESIHPGSKFCPKCGLPLKEDATVMGAYVSDDTPMPMWAIGAGALGILGVALAIGWATGRKNEPVQTVRREPVGRFAAPSGPSYAAPSYAQFGNGGGQRSSFGSFGQARGSVTPFTPNIPVRWAWTPPARPARPVEQAPVPAAIADPEPPRVPLVHIVRRENQQRPQVKVVQAEIPQVPAFPMPPQFAAANGAGVEPVSGLEAAPVAAAGAFNGFAIGPHNFNETLPYVWDPVHERWARRSDYRAPRAQRAPRQGLRTAPSPAAGVMQPQSRPVSGETMPLDGSQLEAPQQEAGPEQTP